MDLLVLFTAALLASSLLTHHARNIALERGWTCASIRRRDVHASPIPRIGGAAIFATFIAVAMSDAVWIRLNGVAFNLSTTLAILVPASMMFGLGLIDDLRTVRPQVKFGFQILAAILLYFGGIRISFFAGVADSYKLNDAISLALTIFWVLLISNAFNLIDGLDGLSAGSALFSTVVILVVSLFSGNALITTLSAILAGAILGFLRHNFHPATIFLGDCGSLFLGFLLSALSLAAIQEKTTPVSVAIPLVSFGLPLLDTILAVLRRFLGGKPLFTADQEHIHHKLLKRGFPHKHAVFMLYGVCALLSLTSLSLLYLKGIATGIVLSLVAILAFFCVQHLGYHEFAELARVVRRVTDQKQIIVNSLSVRRATEELDSADDLESIYAILQAAFASNEFDSFELVFRPVHVCQEYVSNPFVRNDDGSYRAEWTKHRLTTGQTPWHLSLVLNSPALGKNASFTLYREHTSRNLLVDINLLADNFQRSLSEALARALEGTSQTSVLNTIRSAPAPMITAMPASKDNYQPAVTA